MSSLALVLDGLDRGGRGLGVEVLPAGLDRPQVGVQVVAQRDTGIGIPSTEQGKLFTRFFRASTAQKNAVPGVGLGLAITKAITTAHGGTLDLTSVEGEGTTFTLTLPL